MSSRAKAQARSRAETSGGTSVWPALSPHAYEIFPRMAARFAPVADGTFDALRFHVSNAIRANAAASLASEGNPNSAEARIFIFNGRSSFFSLASKVVLLA